MIGIPLMLLTSFISVGGQIKEVPINSREAVIYQNTETDLGKYDFQNNIMYLSGGDVNGFVPDAFTLPGSDSINTYSMQNDNTLDVSGGDVVPYILMDNGEITELLNEQIELLAENSSSVTGTLNSTVLDLMDRMIDDYPSYYKYAGFRTNADDSYQATLYLSKSATYNNNVITFGDDCIAVKFYRVSQSGNNYNYYLTYERYDSPNSTVRLNDNAIVYTNVLEGFPALGNHERFEIEYFWICIFVIVGSIIFTRRMSNA